MSETPVNRAYLALGSNINPVHNLPAAVRQLARYGKVVATSHVWQTKPLGFGDQPDFLNAAVLLETRLSLEQLCDETIPQIERALNRVRDPQNKNGPRTIDIDLVLFNREVRQSDHYALPDPDILVRDFLAQVLAELDPDFLHPLTGTSLQTIARQLRKKPSEMKLRDDVILLAS